MKILLLNPPYLEGFVRCGRWQGARARGRTLYYPIWLSYASIILNREEHEVMLLDSIAKKIDVDQTCHEITKFEPEVIVIETNYSSLINDINVAKKIRKDNSNSIVIFVGPPCNNYYESILRNDWIDIVVRMEYEITLLNIVNNINNYDDIEGIAYRKEGIIVLNKDASLMTSAQLDALPFVSEGYKKYLDVYDYYLDHSGYPMVQIMSSRGCPNKCTFCSWPVNLMGNRFRARSPENVVDEMEWVRDNLPDVKEIFFEDDCFTSDKERLKNILSLIKIRKLKIKWSCQSRADLSYEIMKEMHDCGCKLLDVGFESGNDQILRTCKKGLTVKRMIKFSKDAKKAGLLLLADFMIGLPGETEETVKETADLINAISPHILQVSMATPIPGTDFYNYILEQQYFIDPDMASIDEDGYPRCVINYPSLSGERITDLTNKIIFGYYFSFRYVVVALDMIRKGGLSSISTLYKSGIPFIKNSLSRR